MKANKLLSSPFSALDDWSSRPVSVLGVSAARALLGFVCFMYYVSQYSDRRYLFGPNGVLPHDEFVLQLRDSAPSASTPGVLLHSGSTSYSTLGHWSHWPSCWVSADGAD